MVAGGDRQKVDSPRTSWPPSFALRRNLASGPIPTIWSHAVTAPRVASDVVPRGPPAKRRGACGDSR